MKKADGVFEGGGIKGIGLAGALTVAEQVGENYSNTLERGKPSRL